MFVSNSFHSQYSDISNFLGEEFVMKVLRRGAGGYRSRPYTLFVFSKHLRFLCFVNSFIFKRVLNSSLVTLLKLFFTCFSSIFLVSK